MSSTSHRSVAHGLSSDHAHYRSSHAARRTERNRRHDELRIVPPRQADRIDLLIALGLVLVMSLLLVSRMDYGAVPHDTGTLAHEAERVLQGEMPHRDFDTPYTGLLSMLHAGAFKLWGIDAMSLRRVLLALSILLFLALYRLMRVGLGRLESAAAVTAAFVWSVPNYFSPMPSWYNLFFIVIGLWALFRHAESDRRTWLFIAGLVCGVSFLIKSIGAVFAFAAFLYFVFREQLASQQGTRKQTTPWAAAPILAGLGMLIALPVWLIASRFRPPELLAFVVPTVGAAVYLAAVEWKLRSCNSTDRFRRVARATAYFAAGVLLPVAAFVAVYALQGSLAQWWHGVFVAPQVRLSDPAMGKPIDPQSAMIAVSLICVVTVGVALAMRRFNSSVHALVLLLFLLSGLALLGSSEQLNPAVWEMMRLLPTILLVLVCSTAVRSKPVDAPSSVALQRAFLATVAAVWFGIVQFPVSNGIYLLYVAPLAILAGAHVTSLVPFERRPAPAVLCLFLIAFGCIWVLRCNPTTLGIAFHPRGWDVPLENQRAELCFDPATKHLYDELVELVHKHSREDSYILALPDCPEVYFLTGRKNPTRTFFDAFDDDYGRRRRSARLLQTVEDHEVDVVVMRGYGTISGKSLTEPLMEEFERRFPNVALLRDSRHIFFVVRWRERNAIEPAVAELAAHRN